jgi:hypothetical protein
MTGRADWRTRFVAAILGLMPDIRALTLTPVVLIGCQDGSGGDPTDAAEDETAEGDTTDGDTTDGDTTDGDTGTDGVDEDELATAACDAFANAAPQMIIAAATAGEAATASLVADGQVVYQVTLPEGAAGFVELQIPDWNTTQAFFTDEDIDYSISTMQNAQMPGPREPNAACPDAGITDQRVFFPHWTPATLEFSATGPREILLMIVRES